MSSPTSQGEAPGDCKAGSLTEDKTRSPNGGLGGLTSSHFKGLNEIYGFVCRPMGREYLVGARVHNNPQPHGWVPSIVKYHARLLGVSLYVRVISMYR